MLRQHISAPLRWFLIHLDRFADWLPVAAARLKQRGRNAIAAVAPYGRRLQRFLSETLGGLRYQPPVWASRLGLRLGRTSQELIDPIKDRVLSPLHRLQAERPRAYARGVALGVLLGFALSGGGLCALFTPRAPGLQVAITAPRAYAPGANNPPGAVHLDFAASAAPLDQIGKTVQSGVSLEPNHPGRWVWESDRRLSFYPAADWSPGQRYRIELQPELHAPQFRLEEYDFSFQIQPLIVQVQRLEFYVDYTNPDLKRIVATLRFNYPIDTATVKERLRLVELGVLPGATGREFAFTLDFNEARTELYLQSENIAPPEKGFQVRLSVADGIRSSLGGEASAEGISRNAYVPARDELFAIEGAELVHVTTEEQEIERILTIGTGTEARGEDVLSGLEGFLLPRDRPARPGQSAARNHNWDLREIDPQTLAASERIRFELATAEREFGTAHSFRFSAEPNRRLLVRIRRGARNFAGYTLKEDFAEILLVRPFPRRIAIQQEGALLSLMGEKKISVAVSGVNAVKIEIDRVLPDQINHLVSQTQGDFQNPYFSNYNFNEANLAEHFEEVVRLAPSDGRSMQYFAFDFSRYLNNSSERSGLFFLRITPHNEPGGGANRDGAAEDNEEGGYGGVNERRFVLVSDLGMLVKESATGEHDMFVQSISRGAPAAGVRVEVLGKNGLAVASGETDNAGLVRFPTLRELRREKEPVAFLLRKGSDLSFLPFRRADRQLNFSRFDIGGVRGADRPETLTAFLFTDRGLYRPGETARIGLIVKSGDWSRRLEGVPLELSVLDARGIEVQRSPLRLNREAFHEFQFQSDAGAPTGVYQINLYTVRDERRATLLGAESFRIEEFQPDRMQIRAGFSEESEQGWVRPQNLKGFAELRYLFGQAAADHRVTAEIELAPTSFYFRQHAAYRFFDAAQADRRIRETLAEARTDARGRADFDMNLKRFGAATYRLTFLVQGFEAGGGRSVSALRSLLVSPLERVIGFKADGSLDYITRGATRRIELIAVAPNGERTAAADLKARFVEVRYVSVLARSEDGVYRYTSVRRETPLREQALNIPAGGLRLDLPSAQPGEFVVYIEDQRGLRLNRIEYSIAGVATLAGRMDRGAELQMRLNKADFAPGETVSVNIIAPYVGAGLITIERDKVYAYKWFQTTSNASVQTITVPDSLEGSAYVNVAFIRSPASPEVLSNPLSYGVQPFSISRARRENRITLNAPERAAPGKKLSVGYRTTRPGRIVVFAVDEGILQVARYSTPDPLAHFFRKRALETKTIQILDLLLPEYSLLRRSRPGGGDSGDLGRNLNPFRRRNLAPAVFWSGVLPADGAERFVHFDIPAHFNGSLRIMAVSVSDQALGSAQRSALIQDHFVITPSTPLFLAPGDIAELSIGVANNVEGSGADAKLSIRAESAGPVSIPENSVQQVTVPEGAERVVRFRLQARDEPGAAELRFVVEGGGRRSEMPATLSVRPATIHRTTVAGGAVFSGEAEIAVPRRMYPLYRRQELAVSPLPLGLARGLQRYLSEYPYGCTEQLVSQAMAHLALSEHSEFGSGAEQAGKQHEFILRVLQARQNQQGAFGFWAANSYVSPYQSVYAAHYLTEAKERSRGAPPALLENSLRYLKSITRQQGRGEEARADVRSQAYALYLLARNGELVANEAAALRRRLDLDDEDRRWRQDSTALYLAAAHRLMKQEREAEALLANFDPAAAVEADYDNFYDPLLRSTTYLYLVAKHFPEARARLSAAQLEAMLAPLQRGAINSLSASMSILALDAIAAGQRVTPLPVKIIQQLESGAMQEIAASAGLFGRAELSPEAKSLRIANPLPTPAFYQLQQSGFDRRLPAERSSNSVEIFRELQNREGDAVSEAKVGDDLEVALRVRGLNGAHRNVAVIDLLPGGFEADIDSARDDDGWRPDYIDVREDRVILYGAVDTRLREFRYRIRAAGAGDFVIAPVYAEGMYDRGVSAVMPSPGRIRVRTAD